MSQNLRRAFVAVLSLLPASLSAIAAERTTPSDPALLRIGRPRMRHDGPVYLVAYSPDGRLLASAGYDGLINLWDPATGRAVRRLTGHKSAVYSLAFAPDGKSLVSAGWDRTVRLWDVASGKEFRQFKGHENPVLAVAFAGDGKTIASEGHDKTVRLWEAATGKELLKLEGQKGNGTSNIVFSPDGALLATATEDHTIELREAKGGKLLSRLKGHTGDVESLAFTADGKDLVSGSIDGTLRVWDVAKGEETRQVKGFGSWVNAVAVSPDSKMLAAGLQDPVIRLLDAATGKELRRLNGHGDRLKSLAFAPDGKGLASGALDGTVRLWDVATGVEVGEVISRAALSPAGSLLAVTSPGRDTIRLCEPRTGKDVRLLRGQKGTPVGMIFSGDGKWLAAWGDDGVVRLWDTATGKATREFPTKHDSIRRLALSPGGRILMAQGVLDMTLRRWDTVTGKELFVPDHEPARAGFPIFSPDGRLLAFTDYLAARVHVWDVVEGKELYHIDEPGGRDVSPSMAFSSDRRTLVLRRNGETFYCEALTGKVRRRQRQPAYVWRIAPSPDGRIIAFAESGRIRLTEVVTAKTLAEFPLPAEGDTSLLAWTADGRTLVSFGRGPEVVVWDASPALKKLRSRNETLTAGRLDACWEELTRWDAAEADAAMWTLEADPGQVVALLRKRLAPVVYPKADAERIRRLIADLDSEAFETRQEARAALARFGRHQVGTVIGAELKKKSLSAATRAGLEDVLDTLNVDENGPGALRAVRAIELLERLGTREAGDLIAALAKGSPESRVTREAKESLGRFAQRGGGAD